MNNNTQLKNLQKQIVDSLVFSSYLFKQKLQKIEDDPIYKYEFLKYWKLRRISKLWIVDKFLTKIFENKFIWSDFEKLNKLFETEFNLTYKISDVNERSKIKVFHNRFYYFENQINNFIYFSFLNKIHNLFNLSIDDSEPINRNNIFNDILNYILDLDSYLNELNELQKTKFFKDYNYIFSFFNTLENIIEKWYQEMKLLKKDDFNVIWFEYDWYITLLKKFNEKYKDKIWEYITWQNIQSKTYFFNKKPKEDLESYIFDIINYEYNIYWYISQRNLENYIFWEWTWFKNFNIFHVLEQQRLSNKPYVNEDQLYFTLNEFNQFLKKLLLVKDKKELDYEFIRIIQTLNHFSYSYMLKLNEWTYIEDFHNNIKKYFDEIFKNMEDYLIQVVQTSPNVLMRLTNLNTWNNEYREIISYPFDKLKNINLFSKFELYNLLKEKSLNNWPFLLIILYFLELWNYTTNLFVNIINYCKKNNIHWDWLWFLESEIVKVWFEYQKSNFFEKQIFKIKEYLEYLWKVNLYFWKEKEHLISKTIFESKNLKREEEYAKYLLEQLNESQKINLEMRRKLK